MRRKENPRFFVRMRRPSVKGGGSEGGGRVVWPGVFLGLRLMREGDGSCLDSGSCTRIPCVAPPRIIEENLEFGKRPKFRTAFWGRGHYSGSNCRKRRRILGPTSGERYF